MPMLISIARLPKLVGLDLSKRLDTAAVAASEKYASDDLRSSLAAIPDAVLAYPVTSFGFDGNHHYFGFILAGASAHPAVVRTFPLPDAVNFVYLCQRAARNLYRGAAGDALVLAEKQESEAESALASAKSERDAAANAVEKNASDLTQALKDGVSAIPRRDALMIETVQLGQAQVAADDKVQASLKLYHAARQTIREIQLAHSGVHYVSTMADQALSVTLRDLVEKVAAPMRTDHSREEPYNSLRMARLTWSDR